MRILLWIGGASNQKALANKIAQEFEVAGIVIESKRIKRKAGIRKIAELILEKIFIPSINRAWWEMQKKYEKEFPNYPESAILRVEDINSEAAIKFSKEVKADLILVSGTRLIRKKMLSINSKRGILNLHTGLSPYIKGGPNCTNWCISTGQYHLIGNTIMWIDEGIDSGNIFASEFTEIDWYESLHMIHYRVMEHAHQLYLKALKSLAKDKVSNVAQSEIAEGKTFYTKDWDLGRKIELTRNLKKAKSEVIQKDIKAKQSIIKTVNID